MKKTKLIFYSYLILLIVFVILKFDGSFYSIRDTIRLIKWSREMGAMNINYIPFRTILSQIRQVDALWALKNLLANIIAFIPWGILFPLTYKHLKKFIPFSVVTIIVLLLIESIQFVFMIGYFDVDDILLNFIGACFGYFLGNIFRKLKFSKKQKESAA